MAEQVMEKAASLEDAHVAVEKLSTGQVRLVIRNQQLVMPADAVWTLMCRLGDAIGATLENEDEVTVSFKREEVSMQVPRSLVKAWLKELQDRLLLAHRELRQINEYFEDSSDRKCELHLAVEHTLAQLEAPYELPQPLLTDAG